MKLIAKDKKHYELFKKEYEDLLSDRNAMKNGVEERINNYKTNIMYSNLCEYRNNRISEEEELLNTIEKQIEGFKYVLENLDYNKN